MDSRTVIITGASDGIGKATARQLAALGAQVVMVGRNEAKTAAAARAIMSETGSRRVTWHIADLAREASVQELIGVLRATYPVVHVLINNAGAYFSQQAVTIDGHERTFALNHLGYVLVTLGLLPSLMAATRPGAPARVINVASRAHHRARVRLDDLQSLTTFGGWRAYANSKLYNVWFTRSLARRIDKRVLVVHAMHPGVVHTRFATNNGRWGRLLRRVMDVTAIAPAQAADLVVWLATAAEPLATTGGYWVERCETAPSRLARRDDLAEQLWQVTNVCTGLDADALIHAAERHGVA